VARPGQAAEDKPKGASRRSVRTNLLEAAIELFAREGSRGTPLAAIAERIGVTTPAITHHFGSKTDLLMEVVEYTDRANPNLFGDAVGSSVLERLRAHREWADLLVNDSRLANLSRVRAVMLAEALDPDFAAHDHFVDRHRRFRHQVAEVVQQGQTDESIRADVDAETTAGEIVAFMQGAQVQWFLDPDEVDLQKLFATYFDRLVRDLAPAGTTRRARQPNRVKPATDR
jgi:AcrR family transcriptional regulator